MEHSKKQPEPNITYQQRGHKAVDVVWPNGQPVKAGELLEGQCFTVDPDTGVIRLLDN